MQFVVFLMQQHSIHSLRRGYAMFFVKTATTFYKWPVVTVCLSLILNACGGGDVIPTPKDWGTAELIETDNAGDADRPQVAVNANGNALAVWPQSDGTRNKLWANHYDAATGWNTASLIENDDAGNTYTPRVAFDANGNALVIWAQNDGMRSNIWTRRYDALTGWETAILIENDTGHAGDPRIAFDANGNALAVWTQLSSSFYSIWTNRYDATTGWGTPTLIENDDTAHASSPQVAVNANGDAITVWTQSDGTRYNVWARRYDAVTGWEMAMLIESETGFASDPQIALDANGNALAVWEQPIGSRDNIWANRYDAITGWGTPSLIENTDWNAFSPQVAFDANGNAVAVWRQVNGTRYDVWANRYDAATGWGTATLIETDNTWHAGDPQVAFDTNGNALAVWPQSDSTNYNIWANRYDATTGWGTATLIETDNAGDAFDPQIAFDANGNALAVWRQFDGTRYNIWANRYE